jgi:hypothetical protein
MWPLDLVFYLQLFTLVQKFAVTLLLDEIRPGAEVRIQCPLPYNETQVLGVLWLLIRKDIVVGVYVNQAHHIQA